MSDKEQENLYSTDSLGLTSYLELHGLRFIKAELVKTSRGKVKVIFFFLDPEDKGRDIELNFRFSTEKQYRDGLFFYRKIISEKLGVG